MLKTTKQRAIFVISLLLLVPIIGGFIVSPSVGITVLVTFALYGVAALLIFFIMRWIFKGED